MKLEQILRRKFKHDLFRTGQREVIEEVLQGHHVVAVLPTGTGKSLCYQLPAYLLKGPVLIISPLVSLMEDQVQQLRANGEKRVIALNSFLAPREKKTALNKLSSYRFIYASPEILQSDHIMAALKRASVSLFVVDEAHCISQWGHDFRLDYLQLGKIWSTLGKPTCLALTATATKEVIEDIIRHLELNHVKRLIYSMDRPNIALKVKRMDGIEQKKKQLLKYVQRLEKPGIVYCSSRLWTETLASFFQEQGLRKCAYYHGGMEQEQRLLIQHQFLNNQLDIICCTSAFGMGVNKSNIRFVIHFHLPTQLEAYLQEIGRAGRDGGDSIAVLLYAEHDDDLAYSLMELELPNSAVIEETISRIKLFRQSHRGFADLEAVEQQLFQLNIIEETHWRFIRYHLEKINIITNNKISIEFDLEQIKQILFNRVRQRLNEKHAKFEAVKKLITGQSCRREVIMRYFDEEVTRKPFNCCDICGIDYAAYNAIDKASKETAPSIRGWREELALLLRQGK